MQKLFTYKNRLCLILFFISCVAYAAPTPDSLVRIGHAGLYLIISLIGSLSLFFSKRGYSKSGILSLLLLAVAACLSYITYLKFSKISDEHINSISSEYLCDIQYHTQYDHTLPFMKSFISQGLIEKQGLNYFIENIGEDHLLLDLRLPLWFDSGSIQTNSGRMFKNIGPQDLIKEMRDAVDAGTYKKIALVSYRKNVLLYFNNDEIAEIAKLSSFFDKISFTVLNSSALHKNIKSHLELSGEVKEVTWDWPIVTQGIMVKKNHVYFKNIDKILEPRQVKEFIEDKKIIIIPYSSFYRETETYERMIKVFFPKIFNKHQFIFLNYNSPYFHHRKQELIESIGNKEFLCAGIGKFDCTHYGLDFAYSTKKYNAKKGLETKFLGYSNQLARAAAEKGVDTKKEKNSAFYSLNILVMQFLGRFDFFKWPIIIFLMGFLIKTLFVIIYCPLLNFKMKKKLSEKICKKYNLSKFIKSRIAKGQRLKKIEIYYELLETSILFLPMLIVSVFINNNELINTNLGQLQIFDRPLLTSFFLFLMTINLFQYRFLLDSRFKKIFAFIGLVGLAFFIFKSNLEEWVIIFLSGYLCAVLLENLLMNKLTQSFLNSSLVDISGEVVGRKAAFFVEYKSKFDGLFKIPDTIILNDEGEFQGHFFEKNAVRSSVCDEDFREKSMAGYYESYLNIDREDVHENIKKVRNSFSGKKGDILVQEMIDCAFGGVLFTKSYRNPYCAEIEFSKGGPHLTVSGDGQVDRVFIGRASLKTYTEEMDVSPEILERLGYLYSVGRLLEEEYGYPQDIEWGISKKSNELYIFQSRDISKFSFNPCDLVTSSLLERAECNIKDVCPLVDQFGEVDNLSVLFLSRLYDDRTIYSKIEKEFKLSLEGHCQKVFFLSGVLHEVIDSDIRSFVRSTLSRLVANRKIKKLDLRDVVSKLIMKISDLRQVRSQLMLTHCNSMSELLDEFKIIVDEFYYISSMSKVLMNQEIDLKVTSFEKQVEYDDLISFFENDTVSHLIKERKHKFLQEKNITHRGINEYIITEEIKPFTNQQLSKVNKRSVDQYNVFALINEGFKDEFLKVYNEFRKAILSNKLEYDLFSLSKKDLFEKINLSKYMSIEELEERSLHFFDGSNGVHLSNALSFSGKVTGPDHIDKSKGLNILMLESFSTEDIDKLSLVDGVIVGRANALSHALIIARELNIPVLESSIALELLSYGEGVIVDKDGSITREML